MIAYVVLWFWKRFFVIEILTYLVMLFLSFREYLGKQLQSEQPQTAAARSWAVLAARTADLPFPCRGTAGAGISVFGVKNK